MSGQRRGNGDLGSRTEVGRVLFAIAVTALVAVLAYVGIQWSMVLHY